MKPRGLICAAHAIGGFQNHKRVTLAERCAAAVEGGFSCIGWALEDYQRERASGATDADICAILDDHEVTVAEVEFVKLGLRSAKDQATWATVRRDLLHLVRLVKARHLVCAAGTAGETVEDRDALAADYRTLCEAASTAGALALLEPMPWSVISNVRQGAAIVSAAGHRAAGLVFDTWHFRRAGGVDEDLAAVPAAMIRLVQISDAGPLVGDMFEDTVRRRLFPGEGDFRLVELLRRVAQLGVRAPVSVEVIGDTADQLTPAEMARRSCVTTEAVLAEAGFVPAA